MVGSQPIEFRGISGLSGLTSQQARLKRLFDLTVAICVLACFGWLILIAWVLASIDTKENGFFRQHRVGLNGKLFKVCKIRTMQVSTSITTTVTTSHDPRITALGKLWRTTKIDELPQFFNVLLGEMSVVGPRPDVPGYADKLEGADRVILSVRPGITGPATLKYRNEESILAAVSDPELHNIEVIYPDKVSLNREYIQNWSLSKDVIYCWITITGGTVSD